MPVPQRPSDARYNPNEETLGARLLERGRRRAEPTPADDTFTDAARQIIDMADRSIEVARDADPGPGQHLIDVAFLHPPIRLAGLSEVPLMPRRLVKYHAPASPHDRPPPVRVANQRLRFWCKPAAAMMPKA